jgi:hypothetical protein
MKCDKCKGDLAPYENVAPHDCVGNLVARVQQLEGELEMATTCLHCDYGEEAAVCSCSEQTLDRFKDLVARVAELEEVLDDGWKKSIDKLVKGKVKMRADNRRLREALEPVTKLAKYQDLTNHEVLAKIIDGAATALDGQEDGR